MEDVTIAATKKHLFFFGIQNEFPNQKLANAEDANTEQKKPVNPQIPRTSLKDPESSKHLFVKVRFRPQNHTF